MGDKWFVNKIVEIENFWGNFDSPSPCLCGIGDGFVMDVGFFFTEIIRVFEEVSTYLDV